MKRRLVLFDVDGTVSDGLVGRGDDGLGKARPGIYDLFEVLHALGFEIGLWTSVSESHARDVATALALPHVTRFYQKGYYPGPWSDVVLVVDDSETFLRGLPTFPNHVIQTVHFQHAFEILHPSAVL